VSTDLREPQDPQEMMAQEDALDVKDHPEDSEMLDQKELKDPMDHEDEAVKTASQDLLDHPDLQDPQDCQEVSAPAVSTPCHHSETRRKDQHINNTKATNTTNLKKAKTSRQKSKKPKEPFSRTFSNLMRPSKELRNPMVLKHSLPRLAKIYKCATQMSKQTNTGWILTEVHHGTNSQLVVTLITRNTRHACHRTKLLSTRKNGSPVVLINGPGSYAILPYLMTSPTQPTMFN